jgi:hypothetical protein
MPLGSARIAPRPSAAVKRLVRHAHGRSAVVLLVVAFALGPGLVIAGSPPRGGGTAGTPVQRPALTEVGTDRHQIGLIRRSIRLPGIAASAANGYLADLTAVWAAMDSDAPVATLAPLAVERGQLTLRWSDTDRGGSGIVARVVRLERAPATLTACGEFQTVGTSSLGDGTYNDGAIILGPPPTSGCARASLVLTDRAGLRSTIASAPLRIAPDVVTPTRPARPHWTGGINLFQESAFVTQKEFTWCVAASVQMMVNIVKHRSDRTAATQKKMITYAQAKDQGPYGPGGGTDVTGWMVTLRHFGAGKYRPVGATTPGAALRIAAIAMRQTGRPAGMLVMDGQHAWVLHGFESRTDPRVNPWARITSVRVSGPLYPIQQKHGYDLRPNTRLSVRALGEYFHPSTVGALLGKYVVIVPVH